MFWSLTPWVDGTVTSAEECVGLFLIKIAMLEGKPSKRGRGQVSKMTDWRGEVDGMTDHGRRVGTAGC